MKKYASLALAIAVAGLPLSNLHAATTLLTPDTPSHGEAAEPEEVMAEDDGENGGAAPTKIDLQALDSIEGADAPTTLMPENTSADDAVFLEETEINPIKKGGSDELRQAIRIRELKTLFSSDATVEAEKERARQTKTPEGWRTAMRNYYTVFYKKMIAAEPSLQEPLEAALQKKLAALEQHNIYPSTLIEAIPQLPGSHSARYEAGGGPVQRRSNAPLVDDSDPRR